MNVSLEQGNTSIKLIGTAISAPVKAGKIDLAPSSAVIELALEGTAAQIATFQESLDLAFFLSTQAAGLPGEEQGYLKVTLADATVWTAPVKDGRIVYPNNLTGMRSGPQTRALGSQGLRIELELADYWESTTVSEVPLSNKYGSGVTGGIQVDNHDDTGHDSYVHVPGVAIFGDVPTPAILTLTSATAGLDVMLAQSVNYASAYIGILEGENSSAGGAGASVTPTADANCSGGNYGALAWNGTTPVSLAWAINATDTAYFGGRVYRPVLRLRDLVAGGEKIWGYWEIGNGVGSWDILSVSDGVLLPLDSRLIVFPPMAIPPWPKPPSGFAWEPVVVALVVTAEGAGAHVLNADFVCMLACDGWLRFLPIVKGLATSIRYDSGTGLISRATTGMVSHVPDGPGLMLYPGRNQRIQFLAQVPPAADIGTTMTFKLEYKARRRTL